KPTITGFTPTAAPRGATVTITGTDFTGATKVTFNGAAATTFAVVNASKITAVVPSSATRGKIAVQTPGGTGQSAGVVDVIRPPRSAVTPASGGPSTTITIKGTNLGYVDRVTLGGVAVPHIVHSTKNPQTRLGVSFGWAGTPPASGRLVVTNAAASSGASATT